MAERETPSHAHLEEVTVYAIIPRLDAAGFYVKDGDFPNAIHDPGSGTYEQTLSHIGRASIGLAVSPDYALFITDSHLWYFTKPVFGEVVRPQLGVNWLGSQPGETPDAFVKQFRWWKHGSGVNRTGNKFFAPYSGA